MMKRAAIFVLASVCMAQAQWVYVSVNTNTLEMKYSDYVCAILSDVCGFGTSSGSTPSSGSAGNCLNWPSFDQPSALWGGQGEPWVSNVKGLAFWYPFSYDHTSTNLTWDASGRALHGSFPTNKPVWINYATRFDPVIEDPIKVPDQVFRYLNEASWGCWFKLNTNAAPSSVFTNDTQNMLYWAGQYTMLACADGSDVLGDNDARVAGLGILRSGSNPQPFKYWAAAGQNGAFMSAWSNMPAAAVDDSQWHLMVAAFTRTNPGLATLRVTIDGETPFFVQDYGQVGGIGGTNVNKRVYIGNRAEPARNSSGWDSVPENHALGYDGYLDDSFVSLAYLDMSTISNMLSNWRSLAPAVFTPSTNWITNIGTDLVFHVTLPACNKGGVYWCWGTNSAGVTSTAAWQNVQALDSWFVPERSGSNTISLTKTVSPTGTWYAVPFTTNGFGAAWGTVRSVNAQ
jgi:hypothetical protein